MGQAANTRLKSDSKRVHELNLRLGPPYPDRLAKDPYPRGAAFDLGARKCLEAVEGGAGRRHPGRRVDELDAFGAGAQCSRSSSMFSLLVTASTASERSTPSGEERPRRLGELLRLAVHQRLVVEHRRARRPAADEIVDRHSERPGERGQRVRAQVPDDARIQPGRCPDQLIPEWKASASRLQPRRSLAALTRAPIADPSCPLVANCLLAPIPDGLGTVGRDYSMLGTLEAVN